MRAVKIVGLIIGVVIGLLIVLGWLLPSNVYMERSIAIEAPPEVIFQEVNSSRNFNKWSPWAGLDPNTNYSYSGPKTGVGATISWESEHEDVGNGSQWIVESLKNEKVTNQLEFDGFRGDFWTSIILEPNGNETWVIWTYKAEMGDNYMAKFFGPFMDNMLGPLYEEGLLNLKRVIEAKPFTELEIAEVMMEEQVYLGISQYLYWEDFSQLTELMDGFHQEIASFASDQGINITGPPIARYSNYDERQGVQLMYGLPIEKEVPIENERIQLGTTYSGKAIKSVYRGNYLGMDPTYDIMEVFIHENGYHLQDTSWQVFEVDFRTEPDTAKWTTHIYLALVEEPVTPASE